MTFISLSLVALIIFSYVFAVLIYFVDSNGSKIGMLISSLCCFFNILILIHYDKVNAPYSIPELTDSSNVLDGLIKAIEHFSLRNDLIAVFIITYVIVLCFSLWLGYNQPVK